MKKLHRCAPLQPPPAVPSKRRVVEPAARARVARLAHWAPSGSSAPPGTACRSLASAPSGGPSSAVPGTACHALASAPSGIASPGLLGTAYPAPAPAPLGGAPFRHSTLGVVPNQDRDRWRDFYRIISAFEVGASHAPACVDFLTALGLDRGCTHRNKDGAPPRLVLKAMEDARSNGVDLRRMADGVVERRFMRRVVPTSMATYASHLRMIGWASDVFGDAPLGCSVIHIRRVAAVCTCASTQRGWLSAWAMAHQVAGYEWQGDRDVILRGIRIGTAKCRIPRYPRNRVDASLACSLLKRAASQNLMWWAVILAIAYTFLLRMPSELFQQYDRGRIVASGGTFEYGPIRRKHRTDWSYIKAFCTCSVKPQLCMHVWLPVLDELEGESGAARLGGFSPASWTEQMRKLLQEEGIAHPQEWFGHDVRRGAAADVFKASGVDAMLARGGWRSLAAARPYVPTDEVHAGLLAQGLLDDSSPEN